MMRRGEWALRVARGKELYRLAFQGEKGTHRGIVADFAFAAFRGFLGIRYASVYALSAAAYYLMLGLIRVLLAVSWRKRAEKGGGAFEERRYRLTARLLLVLNIPAGGMLLLLVKDNPASSYPGDTIYAVAAYTFYMLTLSVIHLIKRKKLGSPILSAAAALNFIAALMALSGLQNSLISEFSPGDEAYRVLMNTLTGTGVWFLAVGISVFMMISSSVRKRKGETS